MSKNQEKPSSWQQKIEGEWYGCPSVFDADGTHLGFNKVNRSSVFQNGRTTYYMTTNLNVSGLFRSRFEAKGFAFGVDDQGAYRVYLGPDFYGTGKPYGSLVDAHYYSPGWSSDLRTMVHILPDGQTQVYSSLLYEGPRLIGVFNGLYLMATDYEEQETTRQRIDNFIEQEKARGNNPYVLPMKDAGEWTGEFGVYDCHGEFIGKNYVRKMYRPLDLRRAHICLMMEGVVNQKHEYTMSREGFRHDSHGPDIFGNGVSYGRALFSHVHLAREPQNIKSRDFFIDDQKTQSCVWQFFQGDQKTFTAYGVLKWAQTEEVLRAQF